MAKIVRDISKQSWAQCGTVLQISEGPPVKSICIVCKSMEQWKSRKCESCLTKENK